MIFELEFKLKCQVLSNLILDVIGVITLVIGSSRNLFLRKEKLTITSSALGEEGESVRLLDSY